MSRGVKQGSGICEGFVLRENMIYSLQSTQDIATSIHFNTEILFTVINLRTGSEKGIWEVMVFVISEN
jgi:hypothetical protein